MCVDMVVLNIFDGKVKTNKYLNAKCEKSISEKLNHKNKQITLSFVNIQY